LEADPCSVGDERLSFELELPFGVGGFDKPLLLLELVDIFAIVLVLAEDGLVLLKVDNVVVGVVHVVV